MSEVCKKTGCKGLIADDPAELMTVAKCIDGSQDCRFAAPCKDCNTPHIIVGEGYLPIDKTNWTVICDRVKAPV